MPNSEEWQSSLADWLVSYWNSSDYDALTQTMRLREHTTPPGEIAMLHALVRRIKPKRVLEIGTYFAHTSRALAEAVSANGIGHFDTIDPFGAERAPGIISKWPEAERRVTTFSPVYSMNYFSELEQKHSMLGVVFVDGNHKFDYALYDILCAADRLLPHGAIVVDNLEQYGPLLATKLFLRLNSGWRIFWHGKMYNASEARDVLTQERTSAETTSWAVLLPPSAFYISGRGYMRFDATPRHPVIHGVQLNVLDVSRSMPVSLRFHHIARSYDSHVTGEPHVQVVRKLTQQISSGQSVVDYQFDPPLDLGVTRDDMNFDYFLEIALPEIEDYLLLDPDSPFEIKYAPI